MPPGLPQQPAPAKPVLDEAEPESGYRRRVPRVAPARSQGCRAQTADSRYVERKAGSPTASRSTTRTSEPLDMGMITRAAVEGFGLASVPETVVAEIANRSLVRLLAD